MTRLPLTIDAEHPAFAGHFPAQPIVPGVVLLDQGLRAIDAHRRASGEVTRQPCRIGAAKFLSIVEPGETLRLEFDASGDDAGRLRIFAGEDAAERLAMTAAIAFRTDDLSSLAMAD